jgi:DNA polymerase-3 subunit epsilon
MRYVAIDFETANSDKLSPCSIGLAKMEDGRVLETYHSLIKPPVAYFDPGNIAIHHIKPSDVVDAPRFDQLWNTILLFIGHDPLVAHNAPFDMGILRAMLVYYRFPVPPLSYTCTVRISRKVWPLMESHRLTELSQRFDFDYTPHDALEDAINCGKVFYQAYRDNHDTSAYAVQQLLLEYGIQFQRLTGGLAPLLTPADVAPASLF